MPELIMTSSHAAENGKEECLHSQEHWDQRGLTLKTNIWLAPGPLTWRAGGRQTCQTMPLRLAVDSEEWGGGLSNGQRCILLKELVVLLPKWTAIPWGFPEHLIDPEIYNLHIPYSIQLSQVVVRSVQGAAKGIFY